MLYGSDTYAVENSSYTRKYWIYVKKTFYIVMHVLT